MLFNAIELLNISTLQGPAILFDHYEGTFS